MVNEALPAAFPNASTMHAKDHPEVPPTTPVLDTRSAPPALLAPCAEQPWQWGPAHAHDELQRAKWAAWLHGEARKSWATAVQFGGSMPWMAPTGGASSFGQPALGASNLQDGGAHAWAPWHQHYGDGGSGALPWGPSATWSSWANTPQWPPFGQPACPPAAGGAGALPPGAEAPWEGEERAGNEEAELAGLASVQALAAAVADGGSGEAEGAQQPCSEEVASSRSSASDASPAFGVAPQTTGRQEGEPCAASHADPEATEDDAISHDIASAVHLFLSGADDEDAGEAADAGGAAADAGGAAADLAASPARACSGSGLPAPVAEKTGNCPGTPSPKGVQDFLRVLQQRPLHALITDDVLPAVQDIIFRTVLSLYKDRIRPMLGLVQRRLREMLPKELRAKASLGQSQLPDLPEQSLAAVLIQALLPVCARDARYLLLPPMPSKGEQPVILLQDEPSWFRGWIDPDAPASHIGAYSQAAWRSFSSFLHQNAVQLPLSSYYAAQKLRAMRLQHLEELSLGQLEHMVNLAIGMGLLRQHKGVALKTSPTWTLETVVPEAVASRSACHVKPTGNRMPEPADAQAWRRRNQTPVGWVAYTKVQRTPPPAKSEASGTLDEEALLRNLLWK